MFFLRYTSNPERDLAKSYSYHQIQDLNNYDGLEKYVNQVDVYDGLSPIEVAAKELDLEVEDLEVIDGVVLQKLNGLCAFELESENIEDAIEEVKDFKFNSVYNSKDMGQSAVIFTGIYNEENEEGVLFSPEKIVWKA